MISNSRVKGISHGIERREFLEYAGASVLAGVGGRSLGTHTHVARSKEDRKKLLTYPNLSLKERDWRWEKVRKLMRDHGVDALFIPVSGNSQSSPSIYFTNFPRPTTVLFPADGEPTAFIPGDGLTLDPFMRSELDGQASWVGDWRLARGTGPDLVEVLKEKKLANAHIGTIGVFQGSKGSVGQPLLATYLKNSVPQATFVELFEEFVPIWMVNSEEGLAMFRKAALALEGATEAFATAAKPGATLAELSVTILSALVPYGVSILGNFPFILYAGPEGGLGNEWLGRGLPPPVIKKGHIVQIFGLSCNCGLMEAQVQIAVSVGEPSKEMAQLGRIARQSYESGVKKIRPGVTFGEVSEAMFQPIKEQGAWNLTPFLHSVNANQPVSMRREGMWENYTGLKERFPRSNVSSVSTYGGDIVLQEGMTFVLEPNASFGRKYVNIGGSVICTKDGCEELNDRATQLIVMNG